MPIMQANVFVPFCEHEALPPRLVCIQDDYGILTCCLHHSEVCLLENVRFYPEEEKNNKDFAKKLAAPFDMYVNDAFGTAHRAHGSTAGVTEFLKPSVAGFLRKSCSALFLSLTDLDPHLPEIYEPDAALVYFDEIFSS